MKGQDPLSGLSVPSMEEIVDEALAHFGIATIDLGDPIQRRRLHNALCSALGRTIRWRLLHPLQHASARAVEHVLRLMDDPDYQKRRALSRARAAQVRQARKAEQEAALKLDREFRKQQRRGLLQ